MSLRPRAGQAHGRRPGPLPATPPTPCAQARRALRAVTPAMAAGERHLHGAEPVSSQTGDDGWSPMQAGEGWWRPGRAGRTHREGPQGDKPHPTRALLPPGPTTRAIHHPSSIHPSSAGCSSSSLTLGLTSRETPPSEEAQPVPTCTLPSAETGEEGTPDWLLASAGLGSWDQVPKRHLHAQWGH